MNEKINKNAGLWVVLKFFFGIRIYLAVKSRLSVFRKNKLEKFTIPENYLMPALK